MNTTIVESVPDIQQENNSHVSPSIYDFPHNQKDSLYKSYEFQNISPKEERTRESSLSKRITPFLVLEFLLIGLLPSIFFAGKITTALLFVFLILNILLIDFALCNYFEGKKMLRIWFIESVLSFIVIYLFV